MEELMTGNGEPNPPTEVVIAEPIMEGCSGAEGSAGGEELSGLLQASEQGRGGVTITQQNGRHCQEAANVWPEAAIPGTHSFLSARSHMTIRRSWETNPQLCLLAPGSQS